MNMKVEPVLEHRCLLGEGPVWDHQRQQILWLDIVQGHIHRFTPSNNDFNTFNAGEMVGSIALAGNKVLVACQSGFLFADLENQTTEPISDPEKHLPGNRFNEGKCDPAGRFWAGTMALTEAPGAGNLYVLHTNFAVEKKIENVSISNGMAWSYDEKNFYYIDSPTLQVVSYDYDKDTGNISGRKVIITMEMSEGFPDGMTIDSEGMLWIAQWGGWKVARWNPRTGKKLMQVDLPVSQVTSCTFGGENFEDLYITSASIHLSTEELQKQPLAGSLFVIKKCGFHGLPTVKFGMMALEKEG
jgi:sugar lactone lactonase YvrE